MPNHITNIIKFTGEQKDIENLFQIIEGVYDDGDIMPIDFNKIIPMPKSLKVESGSRSSIAIKYYMAKIYNSQYKDEYDFENETVSETIQRVENKYNDELDELLLLGQKLSENIKLYRHKDWYDWSCENWGTKWNAYRQSKYGNTIEFNTAWSAPFTIFSALTNIIEKNNLIVSFMVIFADEDMGSNTGYFNYTEGSVDDGYYEDYSNDAYQAYIECKGESSCLYQDENGEWKQYECGENCPHQGKC